MGQTSLRMLLGLLLTVCFASCGGGTGGSEGEQPGDGATSPEAGIESIVFLDGGTGDTSQPRPEPPATDAGAPEEASLVDGAGGQDAQPPEEGPEASPPEEAQTTEPPPQDTAPVDTSAPSPQQRAPCGSSSSADCWETTLALTRCASASITENFQTGKYNVHRWASTLHAEKHTTITLKRTKGSWQPVLILNTQSGDTLYDGKIGAKTAAVTVDVLVQDANQVQLRVQNNAATPIWVFVTSQKSLQSSFVQRIPTDAAYSLLLESTCKNPPAGTCVIAGVTPNQTQCGWLLHVARDVVPHLQGTRAEQLEQASVVAWWSLKEGVMGLADPISYSNCHWVNTGATSGKDRRIGPLDVCPCPQSYKDSHSQNCPPWQVGLSAVQVVYHFDSKVETMAKALYPGKSIQDVLRIAASHSSISAAQTTQVISSTGRLRRSWLLRNSAVGFAIEYPVVKRECIDSSRTWCHSTGWTSTKNWAPNRATADRARNDIKAYLNANAP